MGQPHPDTEHRLGQQCHERGRPLEAIGHFRRAQRLDPDHLWSRENLGTVLAQLGRCSEAEALLAPLTAALPQDPWGPYARALAGLELGRPRQEQERLLRLALERGLPEALAEPLRAWWRGALWRPRDDWERAVVRLLNEGASAPAAGELRPAWENGDPGLPPPELQQAPPSPPAGGSEGRSVAGTVTAVIPSRDRPDLLDQCLRSLQRQEEWGAPASALARVLVVDNGSRQPRTAALLEHWRQRMGEHRFEVLRRDEPFNWSRLSNAGAERAHTPLVLFLNDDIELLQPRGLALLAHLALPPSQGAVGGLLLDDRNRVADAGLEPLGDAWLARWRGRPVSSLPAPTFSSIWPTAAVTGACLLVRRCLWERHRFDEGLPFDGNDVAFAQTLRSQHHRHWIHGGVRLRHGVSSSRGLNRPAFSRAADPAAQG